MSNVIEFCSHSQTASIFFPLVAQKLFNNLVIYSIALIIMKVSSSGIGTTMYHAYTLGMLLHFLKLSEE